MYGLWGYLLKAKALAPINAKRVLEGGWYLNCVTIFAINADVEMRKIDCISFRTRDNTKFKAKLTIFVL